MYAAITNQTSRCTEPEFIEHIRAIRSHGFAIEIENDAIGFSGIKRAQEHSSLLVHRTKILGLTVRASSNEISLV